MAITTALSNNFLAEIASGAQTLADTYKAVLIKVGHAGTYNNTFVTAGTPGTGTPSATNIGTDEVTGTGYTSGGITLGTPTITTASGKTLIDFPDSTALTGCTFSTVGFVIVNTTRSNKVVGCVSFGGTQSVSAASFQIDFPAPGAATSLFRVAVTATSAVATVAPNNASAPAWDDNWRTKLAGAKAGTALARCSIIGDSITFGYYASNLDTLSWAGVVKTALQSAYGNGGSGFVSVVRSTEMLTIENRASAIINSWTSAGNLQASTGTWTEVVNGLDGPGGYILQATTVGATRTFTVSGSTIEIFTPRFNNASLAGSWNYQIDGGAVSSNIQSYAATPDILVTTISGLSTGTHTVKITSVDADNSTKFFHLCGVSGRNASGVVIDVAARPGQTSDLINTTSGLSWTAASSKNWGGSAQNTRGTVIGWNGGQSRPADLIIIAFRLNDSATDKAVSTVLTNYRLAIQHVKDNNPTASILLLTNHRGTFSGTSDFYGQYDREIIAMAKTYNCGYLNIWACGYNSWNWMNSQGYWSANNTQVGISGGDGAHLSDAGHAWLGNIVLSAIA